VENVAAVDHGTAGRAIKRIFVIRDVLILKPKRIGSETAAVRGEFRYPGSRYAEGESESLNQGSEELRPGVGCRTLQKVSDYSVYVLNSASGPLRHKSLSSYYPKQAPAQ
jgi:hypothetical protein